MKKGRGAASTTGLHTLPAIALAHAEVHGDRVVMRTHDLGIWNPLTWSAFTASAKEAGNGLASIGVVAGDIVAIVCANRPEWILADVAIQGLGAISLAVDPGFSPAATSELLREHNAKAVIVGDQEQFDKVAEGDFGDHGIDTVIVINTRGIRSIDKLTDTDPLINGFRAMSWSSLLAAGLSQLDSWTQTARAMVPDTICTMEIHVDQHVDGTVRSHSVASSSNDLFDAASSLQKRLGAHANDELYPIASFADPVERLLSEVLALRVGAPINIGEGGELLGLESRDVQPSIAHVPADELQRMRADIARRCAKRGIRRFAVNRILTSSGTTSRSSDRDIRMTQLSLVGLAIFAVWIHRALVKHDGLLRLGIVGFASVCVGILLIGGGFAVRPFIRKRYGLLKAHSLLTGHDVDTETIRLLGALHLHPSIERRSRVTSDKKFPSTTHETGVGAP